MNIDPEVRRYVQQYQSQQYPSAYREMVQMNPQWRVPASLEPPPRRRPSTMRMGPFRQSDVDAPIFPPIAFPQSRGLRMGPFRQSDVDAPIFPPLAFPAQPPRQPQPPRRRRKRRSTKKKTTKKKRKTKSKTKKKKKIPCEDRLKKLRRIYRKRLNMAMEGTRVPTALFLDELDHALF